VDCGDVHTKRLATDLWDIQDTIGLLERCTNAWNSLGRVSFILVARATSATTKGMSHVLVVYWSQVINHEMLTRNRIDTIWLPWITGLRQHLLDKWPLPPGLSPIPDDELLPPQFPLVLTSTATDAASPGADSTTALVPNAIPSTLVSNDRVTPLSHFQDVRLVRIDLILPPSTSIAPGDCITVFPSNPPSTVSRMLQLQSHWPADVPVLLPDALPSGLYSPRTTTLRALLTNHLDPTAVPRRSFLAALAPFATDEYQRERLLEFADPKYADELYDYTTRPRRTILEVLEEFDSVRIPAERILDVFPVLRGRDFSVANHVVVPEHSTREVQVDILVALVTYRTILRIPRIGLCSAYLSPLTPPQSLMVAHKPSPSPLVFPQSRPVIAIATGTGVAPMRAFIQARHGPDAITPAQTVLFFGCRSKDADNYFADEWSRTNGLQLFVAFSREQAQKVYVQDAIRSQAKVVTELVRQNAVVCLCGGSARMAEACRNAIRDALLQGSMAPNVDEAKAMVAKLDWWQEIWS
jgi:sulfite reductase alpha subunit-like flavoprotein